MRLCAVENKQQLEEAHERMKRILDAIPSDTYSDDDIWEDAYNIIFDDGGIRDIIWNIFPEWDYLNIDGSYRDDVCDFARSLDDLMREIVYY